MERIRQSVRLCDILFAEKYVEDGKMYASFFSKKDIGLIQEKIEEYKANPKARSGGGALLKELQLVANFKRGLLEHIQAVQDILRPKVKVSIDERLRQQEETLVRTLIQSFSGLSEKSLRELARVVLREEEEQYTKDELPQVLALLQVRNIRIPVREEV